MDELFMLANAIDCYVRAKAIRCRIDGKMVYTVDLIMSGSTAEIMSNGFLLSVWGSGDSLDAAADDYLGRIEGHRIVFNPMSNSMRVEFDVPLRILGNVDR